MGVLGLWGSSRPSSSVTCSKWAAGDILLAAVTWINRSNIGILRQTKTIKNHHDACFPYTHNNHNEYKNFAFRTGKVAQNNSWFQSRPRVTAPAAQMSAFSQRKLVSVRTVSCCVYKTRNAFSLHPFHRLIASTFLPLHRQKKKTTTGNVTTNRFWFFQFPHFPCPS
jgi:hypothetical protein